jgi:hypothetical protein
MPFCLTQNQYQLLSANRVMALIVCEKQSVSVVVFAVVPSTAGG